MCVAFFSLALETDRCDEGWVLAFMQLKMGRCAQLELPSTDGVTWGHAPPVSSALVQPCAGSMCPCPLIDSQSIMLISQHAMTASTCGTHSSLTSTKPVL